MQCFKLKPLLPNREVAAHYTIKDRDASGNGGRRASSTVVFFMSRHQVNTTNRMSWSVQINPPFPRFPVSAAPTARENGNIAGKPPTANLFTPGFALPLPTPARTLDGKQRSTKVKLPVRAPLKAGYDRHDRSPPACQSTEPPCLPSTKPTVPCCAQAPYPVGSQARASSWRCLECGHESSESGRMSELLDISGQAVGRKERQGNQSQRESTTGKGENPR